MPRIDDQSVEAKRPFKKKAYRPWNLMDDEFTITPKAEPPKEKLASTPVDKVTNRVSIGNQSDTNKESIRNHIDIDTHTSVTKPESMGNLISNHISNQTHEVITTNKTGFNVSLNVSDLIQRVAGLQRKILFHIVEDCILNGTLSSSPISNESLKQLTNADKDTIKTATQRLVNKNLISRGYGKKGRGGFAIFCITDEIRNAVIDAQKRSSSNNGLVTNWVTNKESISTYSSGSNINTTTKEIDNKNSMDISSNWENIDIEPLSSIGFTKTHLRQIILDDKLPSDLVQDSIFAFSFDLENNNKQRNLKTVPLNYFMGILRSGKPYAPPANYESPQVAALRIYLERKKELDQKRQVMEDELFQIAFKEWESKLNVEEKESIIPANVKNSRLASDKIASLRLHFKDRVWPSIQAEYLMSAKG